METIPKVNSLKSIAPAIMRVKTLSGRKLRAMDSRIMRNTLNEQDEQDEQDIMEEMMIKAQKSVMEQARKEEQRRQQLEGLVPRQTMMGKVSSLFRPNRIQPERAREVESNLSNTLPKDIQNLLEIPYEDLMSQDEDDDEMSVFKAEQEFKKQNNPVIIEEKINTKGFSMMK